MSSQTDNEETSEDAAQAVDVITLSVLPPLDSPEFWVAVEPLFAVQTQPPLEELALSTRQFVLRGELEKARKVFRTLYILYEETSLKLAKRYCYSSPTQNTKSSQLIEELAQETWTKVYSSLTEPDPSYQTAYLKKFSVKFIGDMRWIARQQGIEEGYTKDSSRVPSTEQTSLTQPMANANNDGEVEQLTLSNIVADPASSLDFEAVNILTSLNSRLDSEQKQIIQLLMNERSKNWLAKKLHMAEKTLNRKIAEIHAIIQTILDSDERE
jgi:DNA-directed RNA polymerase specialized sigma24 family protein